MSAIQRAVGTGRPMSVHRERLVLVVVADTAPLRFGLNAAVSWSAAEGSSGDEDEAARDAA